LYNHLLSLLPWATDIAKELSLQIREAPDPRDVPGNKALLQEHSSMRLAAYFRVLTWMVKNGAVASVPLAPLLSCYDAQDVQHIEHDESKRHLITFWYYAALAPQPSGPVHASALMLAAQPNTFRRLLDSHVSLRPKERSIQYNQQLLTPFYGLMRAVLDDQGLSQCAKLLPRCELPRLQALVEVATALAPAAKDGSGDNAGGGSGAGGDADASPAAPKPKDEL
jgi:hypothetical protein